MKAVIAAAAAALLLTGCTSGRTDSAAETTEAATETTVTELTVTTTETTVTETTVTTTGTASAVTESTSGTSRTEITGTTVSVSSTAVSSGTTVPQDSLTEQELADMEAADEAIGALMQNPEYQKLTLTKKAETVQRLLMKLASEGTKSVPHPLIQPLSVRYDESMQQFSFLYTCGVLGGVRLKPFDPMMN